MGTTKTQNKKKSAEVINRNVSSITDLASYQGAESNKEVYSDGVTVSKYYTITDRGEVYINKKTVNANRDAYMINVQFYEFDEENCNFKLNENNKILLDI
jgi:hypothetical protein